jgi:hypothetical protein
MYIASPKIIVVPEDTNKTHTVKLLKIAELHK